MSDTVKGEFTLRYAKSVFDCTPTLYIETPFSMPADSEYGPDCLIYLNGNIIHGNHIRNVSRYYKPCPEVEFTDDEEDL